MEVCAVLLAALDSAASTSGPVMAAGVASIVTFLALTGFWVWSLVDAIRRPEQQWDAAGQNKIVWVACIIVLGAAASAVYVLVARSALQRIATAATAQFDPTAFGVPDEGMTYDGGFVRKSL